jgi:hypothetical protein
MYKTSYTWPLLMLLTSMSWAVECPVTRQGFLDPAQLSLEDLLKVPDHHVKFGGGSIGTMEIERSVFGKIVWCW